MAALSGPQNDTFYSFCNKNGVGESAGRTGVGARGARGGSRSVSVERNFETAFCWRDKNFIEKNDYGGLEGA